MDDFALQTNSKVQISCISPVDIVVQINSAVHVAPFNSWCNYHSSSYFLGTVNIPSLNSWYDYFTGYAIKSYMFQQMVRL